MNDHSGFTHISVTDIPALSGRLHLYRHIKTGAELCWLERDCENKTFCIGFQTLPEDDTGVFHILEHSVLCGSEKYPVKEPFVELLKGSLNTFLNALTAPDKIMYPFSSRNDADFRNLMGIYLDAVLHPNIYRNPNIFRQEGWHYELDEAGEPKYVGVVYGEMKGAFSSVDEIIYAKLNSMLFPDSPYRFCAGGVPEVIPTLTNEKFVETHSRYYHPSNANIFLDGSVDLETTLSDIDAYFREYHRREPDFSLAWQQPIPYSCQTVPYEIAAEEDPAGKAYFTWGKVVGTWQDGEKLMALKVLANYLAGSNTAPLTRAILEQGLGQDCGIAVDDNIAQPYVMLQISNCPAEKLPGLKDAVQAILRQILADGLDRQELTATLNRLAFTSKEPKEPYGLYLALWAYQSWMHGGDPAMYLDRSGLFASLRDKLTGDYYAELLEAVFLNDDGAAVVHALPSQTLGKETAQQEKARLRAAAASWTEDTRRELLRQQQDLIAWQQSGNSPEALAAIPHLSVSDLSPEPMWTGCTEETMGDVRILRTANAAAGTVYLNLYFALPETEPERLPELALLCQLLGKLDTRTLDRQALRREVMTWLGKLTFDIRPIGKDEDPDHAVCYLHVHCRVLEENAGKAVSLIRQILLDTRLDNVAAVNEILQQCFTEAQQSLITTGHVYAIQHALSGLTAANAALKAVNGHGYYRYLKEAAQRFDGATTLARMQSILERLPGLPLTVGVTGKLDGAVLRSLTHGFGGKPIAPTLTLAGPRPVRDTIPIPAGVAFAVRGGNFRRQGGQYHGSFALAARILSFSYLWNEVRVQGGAYGSGMAIQPNGNVFCYSFRDPDPARSMGIYRRAAQFLREYCEKRENIQQSIIGAVSDSERLLTVAEVGKQAIENRLKGVTLEQKRAERRQLLNTTYDDLLAFCDLLDGMEENTCVIGGEALLATLH